MIIADLPPGMDCPALFYNVGYKHSDESFEKAFDHLISVEGIRVAPPDKSGSISKYGITKSALAQYLGAKSVSSERIKSLTLKEAKEFYHDVYWKGLMIEKIKSLPVAIAVFDQLVNRGPHGGVVFTQRFLNELAGKPVVLVNSRMMLQSIDAINSVSPDVFLMEYFKAAQREYVSIAKKDASQMAYLRGWLERTYRILDLIEKD